MIPLQAIARSSKISVVAQRDVGIDGCISHTSNPTHLKLRPLRLLFWQFYIFFCHKKPLNPLREQWLFLYRPQKPWVLVSQGFFIIITICCCYYCCSTVVLFAYYVFLGGSFVLILPGPSWALFFVFSRRIFDGKAS